MRALLTVLDLLVEAVVLPVWHSSRLGYPPGTLFHRGIGVDDPQPDRGLGQRAGRAASMLMLALPGAAYLYQGEELGLPEVTDLPDEVRTDYRYLESGGADRGRDGCRVPLPWRADAPNFGFSASRATWLPQPSWFAEFAVDAEERDPASTLWLYRRAIEARRRWGFGARTDSVEADGNLLVVRRAETVSVSNTAAAPETVVVRAGMSPVLSSGEAAVADGTQVGRWSVPGHTTIWFAHTSD